MSHYLLLGYWCSDSAPHWPDPRWFIDEDQDPEIQAHVVKYLQSGKAFVAACGLSPCRPCGRANGCAEQSDGYYSWPSGLAHYVEAHSVRLPDRFVEHVLANLPALPPPDIDSEIDTSWWRSQAGWHDGTSITLPPIWAPDSSLYLTDITRPLTGAKLAFLRRRFPLHSFSTAELLEKLRPENLPWELDRDFAYHRADSVQDEAEALGISLELRDSLR